MKALSVVLLFALVAACLGHVHPRHYAAKLRMERRSARPANTTSSASDSHAKRYIGRTGFAASKNTKTTSNKAKVIKKRTPGEPTFKHSPHTFQLRKVTSEKSKDLHPLMYFQQHANHAIARKARIAGAAVSEEHLKANLKKRQIEIANQASKSAKEKRNLERRQNGLMSMATVRPLPTGSVSGSSTGEAADGFAQADFDALQDNTLTEGPGDVGGTLGLDIQSADIGYFAAMQFGTPPRDFNILVDSGSADTWVSSEICATCGPHERLGGRSSSSFVASNFPFSVTYGSGSVSGAIVQDNLRIGNLSLDNHVFGACMVESPEFGGPNVLFDGLMGTARSELANQGVPTPIEALAAKGDVVSASMGYALGRVADGRNEGTVTFGGINLAQIQGEILEIPNVSEIGFWEAALDDIQVNGVSLNLAGRTAILDTGTTLAIIPEADAIAIHNAIPGSSGPDASGAFTIPCTSPAVLSFVFNERSFAIDPQDLPFVPLTTDLQGECQSAIMAGSIGSDTQYLVGDVFLKSVYFATDVNTDTIGLALQA